MHPMLNFGYTRMRWGETVRIGHGKANPSFNTSRSVIATYPHSGSWLDVLMLSLRGEGQLGFSPQMWELSADSSGLDLRSGPGFGRPKSGLRPAGAMTCPPPLGFTAAELLLQSLPRRLIHGEPSHAFPGGAQPGHLPTAKEGFVQPWPSRVLFCFLLSGRSAQTWRRAASRRPVCAEPEKGLDGVRH